MSLETMAKIEIIGPKKHFYNVVSLLHQIGYLHIEDLSKKKRQDGVTIQKMAADPETEAAKEQLEDLLRRINGILETLRPSGGTKLDKSKAKDYYSNLWEKDVDGLKAEAEELVHSLEEKTREMANKKSNMELDLTSLSRYRQIMEKVEPLAKQIIDVEGFETVAFLLEQKYKDSIDIIKEEIGRITDEQFELVSEDVDENTTAAIVVFAKRYSGPVHAFLTDNVNEVRLPSELKDKSFEKVMEHIYKQSADLPKEIKKVETNLQKLTSEWYLKLKAVSSAVSDRLEEISHIPEFGATDYTFIIEGWLPLNKLDSLKKEIMGKFGERVVVNQRELSHEDIEEAPVVIKNPKIFQPFEMILRVVQPPRYGTIDPTPMIAIFFPLLFGFIVGDMGYAIVIFLVATLMKRKFSGNVIAGSICSIFQIGASAAFIFGLLYGEFFGNLLFYFKLIKPVVLPFDIPGFVHPNSVHASEYLEHLEHLGYHVEGFFGHTTLPLGRETQYLTPFLFISLGFGALHLTVGLIAGMINAFREKAKKHMLEKFGLILVLLGIVAIAVVKYVVGGTNTTLGMTALLVGVVLVFYASGPLNALEHIFGTLSNFFSYMRLIALGVAGVIMGNVANQLGAKFAEGGGEGIIIGIILASLLHIINIVVAAFSPTIHTIRLNIIEFFNRFYEPGGKDYKPFKVRR
ncbi:MAG: hypothetical protein C4562_06085 [Actinobacteria bacterium]|nr:MAG: hypothetical protein C4562_06085 [Actinomycetota bacterium]